MKKLLTSIMPYCMSILRAFLRSKFVQIIKCAHGLHPADKIYTFPSGREWRCMRCRKRWSDTIFMGRPW